MRVLMITGDKSFGPGHERYELQRSSVEVLEVVYWGRGSLWPKIPAGHFDVVTAQDPFFRGLFGMWVAKRIGAKLNVQVHTDLSVYDGMRYVLMQIVLRHTGSVRVVSEKIKQQVLQVAPRAKVTVLPIFLDVMRFKALVLKPHESKNILWIGRFEKEKDPLLALHILQDVLKSEPNAKMVMLGDGSLKADIIAKAKSLPVELPGWQDPLAYLEAADVVLCTSVHESWGASILEALAAGALVVAPDVGVAKEAGATIVPRSELHIGVIEALASGKKGQLQIQLLDKDTWVKSWAASL